MRETMRMRTKTMTKTMMATLVTSLLLAAPAPARAESLRELTDKVIALEESTGMHDAYLAGYYAGLPVADAMATGCDSVDQALLSPRFVFLGDQHDIPFPVDHLTRLVRDRVAAGDRPALVIEFIFREHQGAIDEYLAGSISLERLRELSKFDSFGWSWQWESISRVLVLGRELGLRVISAEEGSNDMDTRDPFSAKVLHEDAAAHPGQTYVVLYGAMHLFGARSIPALLRAYGHESIARTTNFLGRRTLEAVEASRGEGSLCLGLAPGDYYLSSKTPVQELREYYEYLSGGGQVVGAGRR